MHTRETYKSVNQCYLNLKENRLQESSLKYTDKYILKSSRTAFVSNKFWNSDLSRLRQVPTYHSEGLMYMKVRQERGQLPDEIF